MIKSKSFSELESLLEKASKKAIEVNPELHIIEFGLYQVQSSKKDKFYEVRCGRNDEGEYFIACLCLGSLHGNGCLHAAKAFIVHKAMAKVEKDKKQAQNERREQENALYAKTQPNNVEKIGSFRI